MGEEWSEWGYCGINGVLIPPETLERWSDAQRNIICECSTCARNEHLASSALTFYCKQ